MPHIIHALYMYNHIKSHSLQFLKTIIIIIYYIDTSVLLENIPLVKFIKTTSVTRVVYFP